MGRHKAAPTSSISPTKGGKQHISDSYEIRIKSHLGKSSADWFDGTISHQADGETCLTGLLCDQAALYKVLNRLRDMGVAPISVNPVDEIPVRGDEDEPTP